MEKQYPHTFRGYASHFIDNFSKHDIMTLAAALAFYTALSLAPLLLITISVLGLLGTDSQQELMVQVQSVLGTQAGDAVKLVLEGAKDRADLSKLGGITGILVLIFSASGVFSQLQFSLNAIWEVSATAPTGAWAWLRRKLISMGMVVSLGFLSAVSLVASTILSFVFTNDGTVWHIVNQVGTLVVFSALFGAIYKVMPDASLRWRDAFRGGMVTGLLFAIGKLLIGLYLGKSAVGSAYGAAGSLLVFLVWVYYSSVILFIGAEITTLFTPKRERQRNQQTRPQRQESVEASH